MKSFVEVSAVQQTLYFLSSVSFTTHTMSLFATGRMGILITVLLVHCSGVNYVDMTCHTTGYLNSWDGKQNWINKDDIFLSGQYSVHDNDHEDRRYKWDYCQLKSGEDPFSGGFRSDSFGLRNGLYDELWRRGCGGKSALVDVYSIHDNGHEDRKFDFKCRSIKHAYRLEECKWTTYVNDYDNKVNYNCPDHGILRTVQSVHNNEHEDKRWKFECCRLAENEYNGVHVEYHKMIQTEDENYGNDYDKSFQVLLCIPIHVESTW